MRIAFVLASMSVLAAASAGATVIVQTGPDGTPGTDGVAFGTVNGGTGGDAPDTNFTISGNTDSSNSATITGGQGGKGGDGAGEVDSGSTIVSQPGDAGWGGTGSATNVGVTTSVSDAAGAVATATVTGGQGGHGGQAGQRIQNLGSVYGQDGNGGNGGAGIGSASASNAAGGATATATATGGAGGVPGLSYPSGFGAAGGNGGAATATASANGASGITTATATATGGASAASNVVDPEFDGPGANGDTNAASTATGGGQVGASSVANSGTPAVSGFFYPALTNATASSSATAVGATAGLASASAQAIGLATNATAAAVSQGTGAGATATATADAESAGFGSGNALASAATAAGQQASATATGFGSPANPYFLPPGSTTASASTRGSRFNTITATATAPSSDGLVESDAGASIGGAFSTCCSVGDASAFAVGLPSSTDVASALAAFGGHSTVGAAFGAPGITVLGAELHTLSPLSSVTATYDSQVTWNLDTTGLDGHLLVGLLDGHTGDGPLTFTISINGILVFDDVFADATAESAFFDDQVLDLGILPIMSDLQLVFDFSLEGTPNTAAFFANDFIFGATGGAAVPEPGSLALGGVGMAGLLVARRGRRTRP